MFKMSIAACSLKSNCLLYLVVVRIVVLFCVQWSVSGGQELIVCGNVGEVSSSVGLCKSSLEWAICYFL